MKKIIFAAVAAFAMFAMSDIALASVTRSKNTQYSANLEVENTNPLEAILGGADWTVSPQPKFRNKKQLTHFLLRWG